MHKNLWINIEQRQTIIDKVEKLTKMRLIDPSATLTLRIAYYKISNSTLTRLLKTKAKLTALLG